MATMGYWEYNGRIGCVLDGPRPQKTRIKRAPEIPEPRALSLPPPMGSRRFAQLCPRPQIVDFPRHKPGGAVQLLIALPPLWVQGPVSQGGLYGAARLGRVG